MHWFSILYLIWRRSTSNSILYVHRDKKTQAVSTVFHNAEGRFMTDVIGLVLPFFGLIFIGFAVARITRQPLDALGWMNTFVIYVALPALFFQLLAKTPT